MAVFSAKGLEETVMKKKVMLVFGTRPEAIKMCPLVNELKSRSSVFDTRVCVTGQHRQMLDQVLETFGVDPDYDLSIMKDKQSLFSITVNILEKIKEVLELEVPDVVLVHGDTSTTFATSLACFYLNIPVGHVEAGLTIWQAPIRRSSTDRQSVLSADLILRRLRWPETICFRREKDLTKYM